MIHFPHHSNFTDFFFCVPYLLCTSSHTCFFSAAPRLIEILLFSDKSSMYSFLSSKGISKNALLRDLAFLRKKDYPHQTSNTRKIRVDPIYPCHPRSIVVSARICPDQCALWSIDTTISTSTVKRAT